MIIGFDIDGVLADFNKSYAPLISERYDVVLPEVGDDFPDTWEYPKAAGVSDAELWAEVSQDAMFWLNLPPTKWCYDTLDYLQDCRFRGDTIYFITSRPGEWAASVATKWLAKEGFINANVFVADSAEHKAYIARNLALDFFIDDKPENCEAVSMNVPGTYLLDQPWNRYWDNGKEAILRVKSPIQALTHFQEDPSNG